MPSLWQVGNVLDLSFMFLGAESFNQDLSNWNGKHSLADHVPKKKSHMQHNLSLMMPFIFLYHNGKLRERLICIICFKVQLHSTKISPIGMVCKRDLMQFKLHSLLVFITKWKMTKAQ